MTTPTKPSEADHIAKLAKRAADLATVTDPISGYHTGMQLAKDIRSLASRPAYEWKEPASGEWLPINRPPHQWERDLGIEWRKAQPESGNEAALRWALEEYPKRNPHQLQARKICEGVAALAAAFNPGAQP